MAIRFRCYKIIFGFVLRGQMMLKEMQTIKVAYNSQNIITKTNKFHDLF